MSVCEFDDSVSESDEFILGTIHTSVESKDSLSDS